MREDQQSTAGLFGGRPAREFSTLAEVSRANGCRPQELRDCFENWVTQSDERHLPKAVEHGRGHILELACDLRGGFVSPARFLAANKLDPNMGLSLKSGEEIAETGRVCLMNHA